MATTAVSGGPNAGNAGMPVVMGQYNAALVNSHFGGVGRNGVGETSGGGLAGVVHGVGNENKSEVNGSAAMRPWTHEDDAALKRLVGEVVSTIVSLTVARSCCCGRPCLCCLCVSYKVLVSCDECRVPVWNLMW
jgi:hypothetical protein